MGRLLPLLVLVGLGLVSACGDAQRHPAKDALGGPQDACDEETAPCRRPLVCEAGRCGVPRRCPKGEDEECPWEDADGDPLHCEHTFCVEACVPTYDWCAPPDYRCDPVSLRCVSTSPGPARPLCHPRNGGVETCNGTDDDCNGIVDDVPPNSEQLQQDPMHCGTCGHRCDAPNASSRCRGGVCGFVCNPGWSDIDGDPENGCEIQCVVTDGGVEVLDGIDNDCDGETDEDFDL